MQYLVAAVVLLGVLSLLNLALTAGLIRRLRQFDAPARGVPVGHPVGGFTAQDTEGRPVARELLTGPTLVGFFTPGCEPCEDLLPRFVARAGALPHDCLAVVHAVRAEDAEGYAARLAGAARVVVEGPGGPVQRAFQVAAFPAVFLVGGDGTVLAGDLDAIPVA
ncbi:TlpA disulfide reductase family protein [Nonomuraea sp. ATR24]|uniref:TlpA disulfide reductase family protein n=1 Tax=unclassified Nonomuraea TaxID=2593643 RepID=UPI0033EE6002